MGYLEEITDIMHGLSEEMLNGKTPGDNMADKASQGTLFFPCLITDSIPVDMASTIARLTERVYASFVQSVLSMESTINISTDRNPVEFLKRYHRNTRLFESFEVPYDEYDAYIERVSEGKYSAYTNRDHSVVMMFNESDKSCGKLIREFVEQNRPILEGVKLPEIKKIVYEAPREPPVMQQDIFNDLLSSKSKIDDYRSVDYGKVPVLFDKDVKKSNDMLPYQMEVKLMAVNNKDEFVQFMNFIVGVKTVLHVIKSEEIIANTKKAIADEGIFFNFIRWTTGEKALFKDLLLHVNDVRLDVSNKSKGSSPWWMTLKRQKTTAARQMVFFNKHQLLPNATLVITSYEADLILKRYGYNLNDKRFANKLLSSLFLMAFVIVDEASRVMKIIYADTGQDFQVYAMDMVERELMASNNKLGKELVKMVSQ